MLTSNRDLFRSPLCETLVLSFHTLPRPVTHIVLKAKSRNFILTVWRPRHQKFGNGKRERETSANRKASKRDTHPRAEKRQVDWLVEAIPVDLDLVPICVHVRHPIVQDKTREYDK